LEAPGAAVSLHLRGWLDIARRAVVCALKGHGWQNYERAFPFGAPALPKQKRRLCDRCWKDEAR
jgi:hypothetical protein